MLTAALLTKSREEGRVVLTRMLLLQGQLAKVVIIVLMIKILHDLVDVISRDIEDKHGSAKMFEGSKPAVKMSEYSSLFLDLPRVAFRFTAGIQNHRGNRFGNPHSRHSHSLLVASEP